MLQPRQLHVDVTTYCNSHCGGCVRNKDGGETAVELTHLPVKIFQKINFEKIKTVTFNGAYGDFTSHPDVFGLINLIPRRCTVIISTNGSARSVSWWKDLAILLSEFRHGRVRFAVDGVETNELYRRGCNIDSILKNMKSFIDNGGQASWTYIVFKHNEHEIKKAHKLSKEMGCVEFELQKSYMENIYHKKYKKWKEHIATRGDIESFRKYEYNTIDLKHDNRNYPLREKGVEVTVDSKCQWRKWAKVQLDAWGNLWQCCYMPAIATEHTLYAELNLFNLDNNLHKYEYDDIIKGDFFTELFDEPLEICKNCKEYM